jgi:hypothetical protein
MDFFASCGLELPEDFERHDPGSRFVTIATIPKAESQIDNMAGKIADCISPWDEYETPESEAWGIIAYCITEKANNAVQHSRGTAFAAAQYIPKRNLVRAAIGDNGIGIRRSFMDAGLGRDWDDAESIFHAMKYRVSSKSSAVSGLIGEPRNAGVGLTILRELLRLSNGSLTLLSGNGHYRLRADGKEAWERMSGSFDGTICCVEFKRGRTVTIDRVITSLDSSL